MLNESRLRFLRVLASGLLIAGLPMACATREPQEQTPSEQYGVTSAAVRDKPTASMGSIEGAAAAREVVTQIKRILEENRVTQRPLKVLLGEITYQNTEYASPLDPSIKEWLRREFQYSPEVVLLDAPRLRGLEIIEKPKTTAALAELVGALVWLTGEYWKTASGIDLRISVRRRPGDQLLGVAKALLPPHLVPGGMNEIPGNLKEAQANQKIEEQIAPPASSLNEKSLQIEVWVDRGKGAVYVEGDELLVFVRTNRDAHVQLYYTDATNQTYQIFPNRYHLEGRIPGNVVVRIPEPQDGFIFRIKAPFGIESIMALASTKPLGDLKIGTSSAGPFQKLEGGLRGLEVVSSSAQKGDVVRDRFVVTTIPLTGTSDASWD
jgi:hypothetical protein